MAYKGLFFVGSIFIVIGGVVTFQFGRVTTLECDRVQDRCEIRGQSWLNANTQTFTTTALQEATVIERPTEIPSDRLERSNLMYRVVLFVDNREIPLTPYYSEDRPPKAAIAAQINTFILDPSRLTLEVQQDDRLNSYIAGSICAVIGLLIIASSLRD